MPPRTRNQQHLQEAAQIDGGGGHDDSASHPGGGEEQQSMSNTASSSSGNVHHSNSMSEQQQQHHQQQHHHRQASSTNLFHTPGAELQSMLLHERQQQAAAQMYRQQQQQVLQQQVQHYANSAHGSPIGTPHGTSQNAAQFQQQHAMTYSSSSHAAAAVHSMQMSMQQSPTTALSSSHEQQRLLHSLSSEDFHGDPGGSPGTMQYSHSQPLDLGESTHQQQQEHHHSRSLDGSQGGLLELTMLSGAAQRMPASRAFRSATRSLGQAGEEAAGSNVVSPPTSRSASGSSTATSGNSDIASASNTSTAGGLLRLSGLSNPLRRSAPQFAAPPSSTVSNATPSLSRSLSPTSSIASTLTAATSCAPSSSVNASASAAAAAAAALAAGKAAQKAKAPISDLDRKRICEWVRDHPEAPQRQCAEVFGVERSSISKTLKNKEKWLAIDEEADGHIYKHRVARFPELEVALHEWLKTSGPVTDRQMLEQAASIATEQGNTTFRASAGWLVKFRERQRRSQISARNASLAAAASIASSSATPALSVGGTPTLMSPMLMSPLASPGPPSSLFNEEEARAAALEQASQQGLSASMAAAAADAAVAAVASIVRRTETPGLEQQSSQGRMLSTPRAGKRRADVLRADANAASLSHQSVKRSRGSSTSRSNQQSAEAMPCTEQQAFFRSFAVQQQQQMQGVSPTLRQDQQLTDSPIAGLPSVLYSRSGSNPALAAAVAAAQEQHQASQHHPSILAAATAAAAAAVVASSGPSLASPHALRAPRMSAHHDDSGVGLMPMSSCDGDGSDFSTEERRDLRSGSGGSGTSSNPNGPTNEISSRRTRSHRSLRSGRGYAEGGLRTRDELHVQRSRDVSPEEMRSREASSPGSASASLSGSALMDEQNRSVSVAEAQQSLDTIIRFLRAHPQAGGTDEFIFWGQLKGYLNATADQERNREAGVASGTAATTPATSRK